MKLPTKVHRKRAKGLTYYYFVSAKRDEHGKRTSIARYTRTRTPGGPATISGAVRRLN